MKWERWHTFAAAAVLFTAGFYALARSSSEPAGTNQADGGAVEPAPKAPDDLLAELYVRSPNATWTKLQRGIGGAVGILPATMPGVIVALSDLDPTLADELDGTAPIYGAVAGDPADPEWALGLKLVDGRRARGLLIDGDTARFDGKSAPGMTILVPKRVASVGEETRQVAITTNGWLLLVRRPQDLAGLGTYVTRGLATRPPPAENGSILVDIPRSAVATSLGPKLSLLWARAKQDLMSADARIRTERGRAPDFGDPVAIVAALDAIVARRLAVAADLEKIHLAIDVTDSSASIVATLTPLKGDGPAHAWVDGMRTGDAAAALAMPATSVLAMSTRDDAASRTEQGQSLEATLASALGPRLKDPAPIHAVVEAVTAARDESVAIALTAEEPSGVFVRAPIRDAAAANRAVTSAIDLAKIDPFKDLFRVQSITTASEDKISIATFVRGQKKETGVAWLVQDNVLFAAAGHEPLVTLKAGAKPEKKLADEPALSGFITAIGADASTVAIVQPFKLDPKRAFLPAMPITVAVGKHGANAFVRVDLPDVLIREATRAQMGF